MTFENVVPPTGTLSITINGKQTFARQLGPGQKLPTTDGNRIAFEFNSTEVPIMEPGLAVISVEFPDIGIIQTEALVIPAAK